MMKSRMGIFFVGILVVTSLLVACAQPAPTPAPAPKPSPAPTTPPSPSPAATPKPSPTAPPTPTPEAKVVRLVYNNFIAANHLQTGVTAEEWAKRIADATEGRVQIRCVHGGSLLTGPDTLDGVINQIADIGAVAPAFTPGKLPLAASLGGMNDLDLGNKLNMTWVLSITSKLYEEYPPFKAEFQKLGVTPLVFLPSYAYYILSTKPIKTLDDFQGKKIRTLGTMIPQLLQLVGAVPITLAAQEAYTSLQTGVIDGYMCDPPAMVTMKWFEVAKNLLITGPREGAYQGLAAIIYTINNKSFAKLSQKDQDIVKKISAETSAYGVGLLQKDGAGAVVALEKAGVTVTRLSQAEVDKWIAKSPNWYETAAKDLDAKGLPGTEWMTKYKEVAKAVIAAK